MTLRIPTQRASSEPRSAEVFADLRLETGGHRAHLIGDGHSLVLHVDKPRELVSALRRVPLPGMPGSVGRTRGPRDLGRVATTLDTVGLTVDVRGPDGVLLARLGRGAGTRAGRLLTGSDAVRIGSARDLTGTVLPIRRILLATVAAIGIIAAVVTVRRARLR